MFVLFVLLIVGLALMVVELICPRDLYPHASAASTHCGGIHLVRSAALLVSFARPSALH